MNLPSSTAAPRRLQDRLNEVIAQQRDSVDGDCARAELACYFVRQGHFEQAATALDALRRRYEDRPHPAISTWLSLADGLRSHFSEMGVSARDKMRRAHAISAAGRLTVQCSSR